MVATNKQRTNYARLCRAIIDLSTHVLRDILQTQISPVQPKNKIQSCAELKSNPPAASQWKHINNACNTGSYKYFDITLLYKLLRAFSVQELKDYLTSQIPPNQIHTAVQASSVFVSGSNPVLSSAEINDIKFASSSGSYTKCKGETVWAIIKQLFQQFTPNIVPPTSKWGDSTIPISGNNTLGDDIERIRVTRNEVYGHIPNTEISDSEFKTHWSLLEGVMVRMDGRFGRQYKNGLDKIATECMDDETEKFYSEEIERLCNCDQEVKAKIQKVTLDLQDTKSEVKTLGKDMKNMREEVDAIRNDVKTKLEHTEKSLMSQQEDISNAIETQEKVIVDISSLKSDMAKSESDTKSSIDQLQEDMKQKLQNSTRDIKNQQQTKTASIEKRLGHLQKTQKNTKEITNMKEADQNISNKLKNTYQHRKMKGTKLSKRIRQIQDNSVAMMNEHKQDKTYVETRVVETGLNVLEKHGILIYTGRGGEGKSKNSIQIMKRVSDKDSEYIVLDIDDITEWDKVINPKLKTLVRLDDPLGKTNTDSSLVMKCEKYWDKIFSCVNAGKVKIVLTMRENILNENWAELQKYKIFADEHVVNLSSDLSAKLSLSDKHNIFKQHCVNNNISFCKDMLNENYSSDLILNKTVKVRICDEDGKTVDEIINTAPLTGFPQTCFLFCKDRKYTRLGVSFFKHPTQSLVKEIKDMRKSKERNEKVKYCVLSYMLLNNGVVDLNDLDDNKLDSIKSSIRFRDNIDSLDVQDAVEDVIGQYIVKGRQTKLSSINIGDKDSEYVGKMYKIEWNGIDDDSDNSLDGWDDTHWNNDYYENVTTGSQDVVENSATTYVFMHESILEAVAISFADCNMDLLLDLCHWKLIDELVRLQDYKPKEGEIVIRLKPIQKQNLFNRILIEIKNNRFSWFVHPLLENEGFFSEFTRTVVVDDDESILSTSCRTTDGVFIKALKYGKTHVLDWLWEHFRQCILCCHSPRVLVSQIVDESIYGIIWLLSNVDNLDGGDADTLLNSSVKNEALNDRTVVSKLINAIIGSERYNRIVSENFTKSLKVYKRACKYGRTYLLDDLWQHYSSQLVSHDISDCLDVSEYEGDPPVQGVIWILKHILDLREESITAALLNFVRNEEVTDKIASDVMDVVCASDIYSKIVADLCCTTNGILVQAFYHGRINILNWLWEHFSESIASIDLHTFFSVLEKGFSVKSLIWLLGRVPDLNLVVFHDALLASVPYFYDETDVSKLMDIILSFKDYEEAIAFSCGLPGGIFLESCKCSRIHLMNRLWQHFQQSISACDLSKCLFELSKEKSRYCDAYFINAETVIWILQNIPKLSPVTVESLISSSLYNSASFDETLATNYVKALLHFDDYRAVASESCSKKNGLFIQACRSDLVNLLERLWLHFEHSIVKCDFSNYLLTYRRPYWGCNPENLLWILSHVKEINDTAIKTAFKHYIEYLHICIDGPILEEFSCDEILISEVKEFEETLLSSEIFKNRVAKSCRNTGGIWDQACELNVLKMCLKRHFSEHIQSSS